jgi:hypothetical protein
MCLTCFFSLLGSVRDSAPDADPQDVHPAGQGQCGEVSGPGRQALLYCSTEIDFYLEKKLKMNFEKVIILLAGKINWRIFYVSVIFILKSF